MPGPLVVYGAYGYTGERIARRAVERGLSPVLAGRDSEPLARLARELGCAWRAFPLSDAESLRRGIAGAAAVIHHRASVLSAASQSRASRRERRARRSVATRSRTAWRSGPARKPPDRSAARSASSTRATSASVAPAASPERGGAGAA